MKQAIKNLTQCVPSYVLVALPLALVAVYMISSLMTMLKGMGLGQ